MEESNLKQPEKPFSSTSQEREHLSGELHRQERHYPEGSFEKYKAARNVVSEYQATDPDKFLSRQFQESEEGVEKISLDLAPEEHDDKMAELIELVHQKGIKNTLAIVEKMNNPHIEDDFHRFLVEYIREGYPIDGLKPKKPLSRALHQTLYEVVLPRQYSQEDSGKSLKDILSAMEQFFAGMSSVSDASEGQPYYAVELALPEGSEQYSFFMSVPTDKEDLFEKQIRGVYNDVEIHKLPEDYNVFNYEGVAVGSRGVSVRNPTLPIKTYDLFDHDPLNVILNSFSNVDTDGEGAAIQFVISPTGASNFRKKTKDALEKVKEGKSVSEATKNVTASIVKEMTSDFAGGILSYFSSAPEKKDEEDSSPKTIDQNSVEQIEKKLSSHMYMVNVRLVASSRTQHEAEAILSDMESAFNQFDSSIGNRISFERARRGKLKKFLRDFSFRLFHTGYSMPLNISELTTLVHFETLGIKGSSQLKETKGAVIPAPSGLPKDGIHLGTNNYRDQKQDIYMSPEDRLRHMYVIGQTGTGKTTLLKNMMIQDIERGEGVCFIDPHGSDVQDVLACVPRERAEDIIYFDPSYTARPMGLNMLEYDKNQPQQKTFVVNELFKIFQRLYASVPESMGPMFEQYFRNAAALVVEDPESGNTLLDISRVLTDNSFREHKISRCSNPVVSQFWNEVAGKAGGESSLQNIVPYITSKFDVFMSNEIMRPIIAQEHSSFNFREVMDNRKILLVNLSKGTLGDLNANLLGLIIVGKILMATLSRVDVYGKQDINPFYLYIDEFQNVTTDSISTILSEARKYKLSLSIAHQFIAQLDQGIKDSVFGNVGSIVSFRVGSEDAEFLEPQFKPTVQAKDLMNVTNRNAYARVLANGEPVKPFSLATTTPKEGDYDLAQKYKDLSYLTYGENREDIERRIHQRYQK